MQAIYLVFYGILFLFLLIAILSSIRIIPQGYTGVVERLGRYIHTAEAGVLLLVPFVSRLRLVSLKEQVDEYTPQFVITSDNVTVEVDAVLFFQIVNAARSIYEVEDYFVALERLTMTALRDIIGEMTLDQCLTGRERINAKLSTVLDEASEKWGIKVNRVEIRAITPPEDIRVAMEKQMKAERDKRAMVLEAEGKKQSSVLRAEGQKQSAILVAEGEREGARLRAEGRAKAYKVLFDAIRESKIDEKVVAIRYLEALEKVAEGNASKLILPYEATSILGALAGIADAVGYKEESKSEKRGKRGVSEGTKK